MKSRLTMLAGAFVLSLSTATLAAPPTIHERMDHMEVRIERERAELREDLDRLDRHITREKRDDQRRC